MLLEIFLLQFVFVCLQVARTAARHLSEKVKSVARAKKEGEDRLRRIAWLAAREIQHFWANIQQVRLVTNEAPDLYYVLWFTECTG